MADPTAVTSGIFISTAAPGGVIDPAQILTIQSPYNGPENPYVETVTNGLNVPQDTMYRLRHMPEEVYSLSPSSHVVRFAKALLGVAGSGQYRSRLLQSRLQTALAGSSFYELDSFYGNLFSINRSPNEQLSTSPYTSLATYDSWDEVIVQDSNYRARILRLAQALTFGPTLIGVQMAAEAVLQQPVYVFESFSTGSAFARTYGYIETHGAGSSIIGGGAQYGDLNGVPYSSIEIGTEGIARNLRTFTITPSRSITDQDEFNLRQIIDIIKPADCVYTISEGILRNSETEVPLRGVYADSSYWHMVESVIPNSKYQDLYHLSGNPDSDGFQEVLRPINSAYQGEIIVYNGDLIGVVAYDADPDGNLLTSDPVDVVVYDDGEKHFYIPNDAIASASQYLAARLAADGVLQASPYSADPKNASASLLTSATGIPATTQPSLSNPLALYVDGISLYDLTQAVQPFVNEDTDQRFWSTPPRYASDSTVETLELRFPLSPEHLVNNVSFEVAHFPQLVEVLTLDDSTGEWTIVYSEQILNSVPAVIPLSPPTGHQHPQHIGTNHWYTINATFDAKSLSQLKVQLSRLDGGTPPVTQRQTIDPGVGNVVAEPVPYSLGLKNLIVDYSISKQSDLPNSPLYATDFLGSRTKWSVRQNTSENALSGDASPWRSSPQPSTDSVVNFYLDTRDKYGLPQVIDQIYIDPLYVGPHMSLYYSDDNTADLGVTAEYTPLSPPASSLIGAVTSTGTGLLFSDSVPSYANVSNEAIQFDPTQQWWLGLSVTPQFSSNNASGQTLWATDSGLSVSVTTDSNGNGVVRLQTGDARTATFPVSFNPNDHLVVAVVYLPIAANGFQPGIYLFAEVNPTGSGFISNLRSDSASLVVRPEVSPIIDDHTSIPANSYVPANVTNASTTVVSYGGSSASVIPGNFILNNTTLVQGTAAVSDLETFASDPAAFCISSAYSDPSPVATTNNSLLRFAPSFVSSTNPAGMVGGPGNFYPNLNWTRTASDYFMSKGYVRLPPTLAKFFKLEFTNLVPAYVNPFQNITRTIRTHQGLPATVVQEPFVYGNSNPGSGPSGTSVNQQLLGQGKLGALYTDSYYAPVSPVPNQNVLPATAMQVVSNLNIREQQALVGWWWQYQKAAFNPNAPAFVLTGTHTYNTATVNVSSQIGYFVGLNEIRAFRAIATSPEDNIFYDEMFLDEGMIASNGWNRSINDLNTVGISSLPVACTSVNLPSSTPIKGIQFATSQSDAVQIAYDDEFVSGQIRGGYQWNSTNYPNSIGYLDGSGNWKQLGDGVLSLDEASNQVQVVRNAVNLNTQLTTLTTSASLGATTISVDSTSMLSAGLRVFIGVPAFSAMYLISSVDTVANTITFAPGLVQDQPVGAGVFPVPFLTAQQQGRFIRPDVHPIMEKGASSSSPDVQYQSASPSGTFGGLATSWQTVGTNIAQNTTLWAAVKVTATSQIDTPLFLEIVKGGISPSYTQTILASKSFTPSRGQAEEVIIGLQLNANVGDVIYAQIVQRGSVNNSFSVQQLSLFDEGMIWEFSNDQGGTWVRSFDTRDSAYGVVSFAYALPNLSWRVTATREDMHVHALRLRPVYVSIPVQYPQGTLRGPNLTLWDTQPPIEEDPLFNSWSSPVPFWWFYKANPYPTLNVSGQPNTSNFSRSYTAQVSDNIDSSFATSATSTVSAIRSSFDFVNTLTDSARPASQTINVADGSALTEVASAVKIQLPLTDPLVEPPVHPIEG